MRPRVARRSGDALLDALAQHCRLALIAVRPARKLRRPTGTPQKNNNPVRLMACASRDMSWRTAPASLGAA